MGGMCVRLSEIVDKLGLKVVHFAVDCEITGGYVGDLLSIVMRSAKQGNIWMTVQSHVNIIAVATLTGVRAIVLCEGLDYPADTIEKAKEEGISLFLSKETSYKVAGRLYELGVKD